MNPTPTIACLALGCLISLAACQGPRWTPPAEVRLVRVPIPAALLALPDRPAVPDGWPTNIEAIELMARRDQILDRCYAAIEEIRRLQAEVP